MPSLRQRRSLRVCAHLVWPVEVIDCSLVLVPSCLSRFTVCSHVNIQRLSCLCHFFSNTHSPLVNKNHSPMKCSACSFRDSGVLASSLCMVVDGAQDKQEVRSSRRKGCPQAPVNLGLKLDVFSLQRANCSPHKFCVSPPQWHQGCVHSPVPTLALKPCSSNGSLSQIWSQHHVCSKVLPLLCLADPRAFDRRFNLERVRPGSLVSSTTSASLQRAHGWHVSFDSTNVCEFVCSLV